MHEINDFETNMRLSGVHQSNEIISFRQVMFGDPSIKIRFDERNSLLD